MTREIELGEHESLVESSGNDEHLFRQIPEHLYDPIAGQPAAHAFGPSTADAGKASYTRSSVTSAQESRDWYNAHARRISKGVYAVSVDEVAASGTYAVDDSRAPVDPERPQAPGHCYVSFRGLAKGEVRRIRAILLRFAIVRGEIPTTSAA